MPIPAITHFMQTRVQIGTIKPILKYIYNITKHPIASSAKPRTISTALQDPNWHESMSQEFNALVANRTLTLVLRKDAQNVVKNKWVFRTKRKSYGSVKRLKSRLVVKGFHQQLGINFKKTFSLVVKPSTIITILCIVLTKDWSINHLDVNKAFLQGTQQDEVYMLQPTL